MSSKTRLRRDVLPLLTGLALVACTDTAPDRARTLAVNPAATAGASNTAGTAPGTLGTPTSGAPTAGTPTGTGMEGGPMPGGITTPESPPTGVVACDESAIAGNAPNTLRVDVNGRLRRSLPGTS